MVNAGHSPSLIHRAHGTLRRVLDLAINDEKLARNPAQGVSLPRKQRKAQNILTHAQVELLASEASYDDLVRFLAYTGLRYSEAIGLKVGKVDLKTRRISVEEVRVWAGGKLAIKEPKTYQKRSVVFPEFLDEAMAKAVAGKNKDDLVWCKPDGTTLGKVESTQSWFAGARKRAQQQDPTFPRPTVHDLRHTAAALAISAGANVKLVQTMLGHESASMTLDTYAGLFPDDQESVAERLTAHREEALRHKI